MAKIKYNVKGVDRGGTFEQPKPGLYEMEITEATHRDSDGKNDIELVLEITKNNDNFVGSKLWSYVSLGEASQWKLGEFTDALGLPEEGTIETSKLKGKKMKVKVNGDTYNEEYRARVGRFAPLVAEATDDEPGDDPDADDPDAGTAGEFVTVTLKDVELSNDPDYYDDWSEEDTLEEIDNQGLKLGKKKKTKANVVAALIELVNEQAGAGTPDADGAGDDADNYDDEEAWSDKDLAAEYKKRGLETIEGKKNRAKVIAALRADDADDDPFAD